MDRDVSLWHQVVAGDSEAFLELYDRHSTRVYSMALRMLRDRRDADSITQKVFFSLWERPGLYDPERAKLSTWLLAVTRNAAIDRLRASRRQPLVFDDEAAVLARSEDCNALQGVLRQERSAKLAEALETIPAEQRAAIYLNFYDDMSHGEIAEALDQPLGTIKTRIQLGLKKLRRSLGLESR